MTTTLKYTRPCSEWTAPDGRTVATGETIELEDDELADELADNPGFQTPRCQATTADGTQCQREATEGDFCAQHADQESG